MVMLTYADFEGNAVRTMQLANQAACRLGHDSIRPEHILIGLCRNQPPTVLALLEPAGVKFEQIYTELCSRIRPGPGDFANAKVLPQQTATQVTEHATQVASTLGATAVANEHLLLGILFVQRTLASKVLAALGIRYDDVLAHIKRT